MTSTEPTVAERVALELILIGKAEPTFRVEQLGSSARAIRAFAEAGEIEGEVARDNLLLAATRAGIDVKEASRIIQWAWPAPEICVQTAGAGHAPEIRELYPAAFPPPEPDGFEEVAARLDDMDRTGEHPTGIVAAAAGLDRLVEHMRAIDDRRSGPPCSRWELAVGTLSLVPDHLGALIKDVGRRFPDDHLADGVAILIMLAAQLSADLGLDLGSALIRYAPTKAATPA